LCSKLTRLELPRLLSIEGFLLIVDMPSLVSLSGLDPLRLVTGGVVIERARCSPIRRSRRSARGFTERGDTRRARQLQPIDRPVSPGDSTS
jgi:hypothetical protein